MTGILDEVDFDGEGGREQANAEPMERADSIEHLVSDEQGEQAVLEDATLEPAAQIETAGDYAQSEAIEAAMTEMVDEALQETAEGGKRDFGQESSDPSQAYSGVQMAQGEVLADQDWNEGANAPPTEEGSAERQSMSTSGDADDRPVEEINAAASEVIARVVLEDGFHDRLMEDPDTVLSEHGLNREDLPDLNDPNTPEAEAFMRDVERRVDDGLSQNKPVDANRDQSSDDPVVEMRSLALQLKMDRDEKDETRASSTMKKYHNTMKDLINNLK